jgi:hypothetical protein
VHTAHVMRQLRSLITCWGTQHIRLHYSRTKSLFGCVVLCTDDNGNCMPRMPWPLFSGPSPVTLECRRLTGHRLTSRPQPALRLPPARQHPCLPHPALLVLLPCCSRTAAIDRLAASCGLYLGRRLGCAVQRLDGGARLLVDKRIGLPHSSAAAAAAAGAAAAAAAAAHAAGVQLPGPGCLWLDSASPLQGHRCIVRQPRFLGNLAARVGALSSASGCSVLMFPLESTQAS